MTPPAPILDIAGLRGLEAAHAAARPPLMERAGQAAAAWALELLAARSGPVLVLCGPGNNGGDGFVLARVLREAGHAVVLVGPAPAQALPPDAEAARARWLAGGGEIAADFGEQAWALVVDALFGIGLRRPLAAPHAGWVARLATLPARCPVLALDLPSGLDAMSGHPIGACVSATHTASFIAHVPGVLTLDGPDHCGELRLFDLGVTAPATAGRVLAPGLFAPWLRPRRRNVHKGSFGSAGIVGGAAGMQGAALLAARAALHLGAGKVFAGLLDAGGLGVDGLHPELMLREASSVAGVASALAVGPGLGRTPAARDLLRQALDFAGPLVLDADALNLLAGDDALAIRLSARQTPAVLTPHPAEAARLMRGDTGAVQRDRVAAARAMARHFHAVVVLKGCGSVIAAPDGSWFINPGGHGGMAAGGMGDALCGLIVALLAQGWPAREAACAATHLHTCAADVLAREGIGPVGLTPSETLPAARRLFNAWLGGDFS